MMKVQNYLCVDLRTWMQNTRLQEGEIRNGLLTMTRDGEKFEFEETTPTRAQRFPIVYSGKYINVSLSPDKQYRVHFHQLSLDSHTSPRHLAEEIACDITLALIQLGID